jgi:hypothetical protein
MIEQSSSATAKTKRYSAVRHNEPSFLALAAKVFWGSMPARTVALVACYPGEGTSFVSEALKAFLVEDGSAPVSLLSAEEFLASATLDSSRDEYLDTGSSRQSKAAGDQIVLVDCPAIFSSAWALRVSPQVDGVLLVVEDGARSRSEIQRATSMIEAAEGRVLGAILNKRRYLLPEWLYSLLS